MKKGKRIKKTDVNGEIPLPEAMLQSVQSFMSGKEAARTTVLSKSWYHAWLTRPTIDLDETHFKPPEPDRKFEEFATKTMQRYIDLSRKIDSFRLYIPSNFRLNGSEMIVSAMKMGATDLQLALPHHYTLPQEVVGSKTLVTLSLSRCSLDGSRVCWPSLKSLSLASVNVTSDVRFKHIISSCNLLEELSISSCYDLTISRLNLKELLNLRRLFLYHVSVDNSVFTDFASRFPCMKDLTIINVWCRGSNKIQIDSPSLETVNFESNGENAKFDVPNIRQFTYKCHALKFKLSVTGALREWKFDVTVCSYRFHMPSWFLNLKKMLQKFRLSRISLSLKLCVTRRSWRASYVDEVDEVVPEEPLVVENLTIEGPSTHCCALLVRLFGMCRPKFITLYRLKQCDEGDATLLVLCKQLMKQQPTRNGGIPDQGMFGKFGLKKVKVKVYEMFGAEWRPLLLQKPLDPSKPPVSKYMIQFELMWKG